MKRLNKEIIKENIFSVLIGTGLYVVSILIFPSIKVNSIIDIVMYSVCYLLGGVIYGLLQKNESKNI